MLGICLLKSSKMNVDSSQEFKKFAVNQSHFKIKDKNVISDSEKAVSKSQHMLSTCPIK